MFDWIGTYDVDHVEGLVAEITRQKLARRDYIYSANKLEVDDEGRLVFAGSQTFQVGDRVYTEWADAEAAADAENDGVLEVCHR